MPVLDYDNELTALGGQGPIIATAFSTPAKALDAGPGAPLGATPVRDWGAGEPIRWYGRVTQAFNNLTSLDIAIGGADDNAGTNFVVYQTVNFLLAALTLNAILSLGFIPAGRTKKRFLLARFTVNGAAPTTGKITCGLVDRQGATQDGFNTM